MNWIFLETFLLSIIVYFIFFLNKKSDKQTHKINIVKYKEICELTFNEIFNTESGEIRLKETAKNLLIKTHFYGK